MSLHGPAPYLHRDDDDDDDDDDVSCSVGADSAPSERFMFFDEFGSGKLFSLADDLRSFLLVPDSGTRTLVPVSDPGPRSWSQTLDPGPGPGRGQSRNQFF